MRVPGAPRGVSAVLLEHCQASCAARLEGGTLEHSASGKAPATAWGATGGAPHGVMRDLERVYGRLLELRWRFGG